MWVRLLGHMKQVKDLENSDRELLKNLQEEKLALVQQGKRVFDLSMINPDIAPPRYLVDRLVEASTKPTNHRYGAARGIRRLREAFASKYESAFRVSLDPEHEICVTSGTKDAFQMALRVISNTLDVNRRRVLLGAPTYPAHLYAVQDLGLAFDFYDLSIDFETLLGKLEEKLQTGTFGVIALNFPNNPTGLSLSRDKLMRVVELATRHDVFLINDFVYGEMSFDVECASSILTTEANTGSKSNKILETYSLSKAYSVPGWRVGALLGSRQIVEGVSQLKSRSDYGLFLPIQLASALALTNQEALVKPIVEVYRRRARYLAKAILELGFEVEMPTAGASVWAMIPKVLRSTEKGNSGGSINFVRSLLREKGLLLLPGALFGSAFNEFVRFALVRPDEELRSVVGDIQEFLEKRTSTEGVSVIRGEIGEVGYG